MQLSNIRQTVQKGRSKLESYFVPYIFFSIITLLMLLFVKGFSKDTFMPHPQFGLDQNNLQAIIDVASSSHFYTLYFVVDMFFWISILWIFYIVFHSLKSSSSDVSKRNILRTLLLVLGILGIISDISENLIYLNITPSWFDEDRAIYVQYFKEYMMKIF